MKFKCSNNFPLEFGKHSLLAFQLSMLQFRSLGLSLYSIFCNDSFFFPLSEDVYILPFTAKVVKFPTDVTHVGNLSVLF